MRKVFVSVSVFAMLLAACAKSTSGETGSGGSASASAASCQKGQLPTLTSGTLTIGTDNPAYPPYFAGGTSKSSDWKVNDPNNDKGFEDVVAYSVAEQLGYPKSQVTWVVAPFNQTYKPGPLDWDFAIEQISYSPKRAQAVDFSDSYYDVNQALVAVKGTPIANASSLSQLKNYTLAAPIGTTSYDYITNVIQPTKEPGSYDKLSDTVAALNAGQVDGIIVDLPTALYIADPYVQQVKNSTVVGQFPTTGTPEHFGMTFQKGSPLVACVNQALAALKSSGQLDATTKEWLSDKTNVGKVPVFTTG
jgi:polar amino acid transport system substrate-binding protein